MAEGWLPQVAGAGFEDLEAKLRTGDFTGQEWGGRGWGEMPTLLERGMDGWIAGTFNGQTDRKQDSGNKELGWASGMGRGDQNGDMGTDCQRRLGERLQTGCCKGVRG